MKRNIHRVTCTAAILVLLLCLQSVGVFIPNLLAEQLITGTLINFVLAVAVLLISLGSGIAIAVLFPVCNFLLGITPGLIAAIPVILGNLCFVILLRVIAGNTSTSLFRHSSALITAACTKFLVLYLLGVKVICERSAAFFLDKKIGKIMLLTPSVLKTLPAMFAWPQLVTALAGGLIAMLIAPMIRKVDIVSEIT